MELYKILELDNEKVTVVVNPPENYFNLLGGTVGQTKNFPSLKSGRFDVIHLFITDKIQLAELLKEAIFSVSPWGTIWISTSIITEKNKDLITEPFLKKSALQYGLLVVDTTVIDENWNASKLIFKEKRASSLF
jgi:hypothetical protein